MRRVLAFLLFFIISFSLMCFFLISGRDITVGFARERGIFNQVNGEYTDAASLAERKDDRAGYITIPLPDDLAKENVVISKDYNDKLITVSISPVEQDFYHKNLFSGEMNMITNIKYGYNEGTAYIVFKSDSVVEPVAEINNDKLFVKFVSPKEKYNKIIVIDPGHGGDDSGTLAYGIKEKDIINGVLVKLREKLVLENVGVYYTRADDRNISDEERLQLIRTVSADLVLSIHTGADPRSRTTEGVGVLSLSSNRALAGIFSKRISETCSMEDHGWVDGSGIELLKASPCDFIMLELGFITNKKEALLMSDELYSDKAAESLANTIEEIMLEKNNE